MMLDQGVNGAGRPARVLIDPVALAFIGNHVRRCYPAEAIGLLVAVKGSHTVRSGQIVINEAVALTNRAKNPRVSVQVTLAERDRCLADLAERGLSVIGAYHSHPDAAAEPSAEDLVAVRGAGIEIIASASRLGVGMVRAWWLERGHPPIELELL